MAEFDRRYGAAARSRAGAGVETLDQGLRAFMLGIYNNMAIGLALTGAVAYGAYTLAVGESSGGQIGLTAFGNAIYNSPLRWVIMLAPLAFVFGLSAAVNRMQPATARLVFFAFAAVMGLSMSSIFLVFTHQSIAQTFFVTAASFGALSLWGYTTKRDISGWGSFLFMGMIGIIIAMLVNIFLEVPGDPVRDFGGRRAGLRRIDGLRHAAAEEHLRLRSGRSGRGGPRVDHRCAATLPRLHQPVHVPAAVHGKQPQLIAEKRRTLGRGASAPRLFCAAGLLDGA